MLEARKNIETILQNSNRITEKDITNILSLNDSYSRKILIDSSSQKTIENFGSKMLFKAKMCISNHCSQNCKYCFCNSHNKEIDRKRLQVDEILELARQISSRGIKSIILKSGVDNYYNTDMISHIIYTIKAETDVDVTLALCERKKEEYISWAIAGADNYLFIYGLNDKYINLKDAKNEEEIIKFSDFQKKKINVSVELIVGIPGQQIEEIAQILLMLKNTNIESLIITPYTSFAFTPVNDSAIIALTRLTVSAARLVMPHMNIFSVPSVTKDEVSNNGKANIGNNGIVLDFSLHEESNIHLKSPKKKGKVFYSS